MALNNIAVFLGYFTIPHIYLDILQSHEKYFTNARTGFI